MAIPEACREPALADRISLIAESYRLLLGQPLVDTSVDPVVALWAAPFAILAHGTEPDPIFFFGNAFALDAFDTDFAAFTAMPSRLSAEVGEREERQALLDRVAAHGFIDDYAGMRISAKGRRFRISGASVWNLVDTGGQYHGQAAMFRAQPGRAATKPLIK